MSAVHRDIIEIPVSAETKRRFESAAREMHLTPEAYLAYLMERAASGVDADRLDRHVQAVFGRQGELIRRLAK
jgi:hypothetical protein